MKKLLELHPIEFPPASRHASSNADDGACVAKMFSIAC